MKAFLRALLGRWLVVAISVAACLLGGLVVMTTSPPRYKGTARVVLDYIRPDPATGAVVPSKMLEAYIASQVNLIRDFQVTGPAVEALGFVDNPDIQAAYYANPPADGRDLHSWIATQVGAAAGGRIVEDSNILEIIYIASTPELAASVVDALRAAYVESSAAQTRQAAEERAVALSARIQASKSSLAQLEAMQNRAEDVTGLTMGEKGRDEESAKLESMMRSRRAPIIMEPTRESAAAVQLRMLDAEIDRASAMLGPNNPRLLQMQRYRQQLQVQADLDRQRAAAAAELIAASERAAQARVQQQIARVLDVREPTLRLRLLQDEINRQRKSINEMTEALIQARTLSNVNTTRTTAIGPAEAEKKPVFPNKPLILLGSAGLGLVGGILLAIFVELMGRRIRAPRDLEAATGVRVLAELPDYTRPLRRRLEAPRAEPPAQDGRPFEPAMAAE